MNIKDAIGLAKRLINCIVMIITNYYQIAVGKASYLIKIDIKDTFLVNLGLANSLNTR